MRVLVLSKRQYTGKDLLDDRYGRLYQIPAGLARRGHELTGLVLSYRRRGTSHSIESSANPRWRSIDALPAGVWRYPAELARTLKAARPDVIWACSDAYHAILGAAVSRMTGIPLVVDLYDNFESFGATRVPGIQPLLRAACRQARALTVVSRSLRDLVAARYGVDGPIAVVGNGVDPDLFARRERPQARARLDLPADARLIGTAGAISAGRGIAALFDAFMRLSETDSSLYLVFAGPRDETPSRYRHPRIIDLGELPFERVPDVYSALDVAVICNLDSDFGRYCFPQKLFEIVACGTPMVAAAVGDVSIALSGHPESLYRPGDTAQLAERIAAQLANPRPLSDLTVPSWDDWSGEVEQVLRDAAR